MGLTIDKEFANLIQPLQAGEVKKLTDSLLDEGCRDTIVAWNDTILDGHNRFRICTEHNIEFDVLQMDFDTREEAMLWMIRNQQGRRNLSEVNRGKLALKKKSIHAAQAKANQSAAGGDKSAFVGINKSGADPINTRKILAEEAELSQDKIGKIEKVESMGTDGLKEHYADTKSKVSINLASQVCTLEDQDQEEFLKRVEAGEKPTAALYEIEAKYQPQVEKTQEHRKGNFERLAKTCLEFSEGLQFWADGTMNPEGREEQLNAQTVLKSAPNIIAQYLALGVDVVGFVKVVQGEQKNAIIGQPGSEKEGKEGGEIIDVVVNR